MVEMQQKVAERASQHLEQLQQAALQAAFAASEHGGVPTLADALAVADKEAGKKPGNSGNSLPAGPGPGRPKGVRNRLTALRDSILDAFDQVGGTAYLAKLAQGTQSDRAAFIGLVKHVLPAQIDANVSGGIQVQLSWLAGRQIGTTAAQPAEVVTQVVDLAKDSTGKYRMIDPQTQPAAAPAGASAGAAAGADKAEAIKRPSNASEGDGGPVA